MQSSDQVIQPLNILEDELNRKRKKLLKALEQGEKIQNLQAAPEWEFYNSWLEAVRADYQKHISSTAFVNDHNGYLLTLGALQAIDTVIRGTERFIKVFDEANKQQYELDKEFDAVKEANNG